MIRVINVGLPGVLRVEPRVFADKRGIFYESWAEDSYTEAGIPGPFVQDNISSSTHGTLRGLHLQHPHDQGKLVHVLVGEIFDVAVDVRLGSPDFGQWHGARLSETNHHQLYIPPGFAHGFCVLSETALFAYKCSERYHPESEITVAWDDPEIGIQWPIATPTLSDKDRSGRLLSALLGRLPSFEEQILKGE